MISDRRIQTNRGKIVSSAAVICVALGLALVVKAQSSDPWTASGVIEPAALAKILKEPGPKPLILQVGFERLYQQGHIPDTPYCGQASSPEGIERLKGCVDKVPKTQEIVLYCGCCPWPECPNIRPAFKALHEMGYSNVKVLHIAHNFGRDWTAHDYPTTHESAGTARPNRASNNR